VGIFHGYPEFMLILHELEKGVSREMIISFEAAEQLRTSCVLIVSKFF